MKVDKLDSMVKGWFIGNFSPTVVKTADAEVGVKHYEAGDYEAPHFHKVATEITVIVEGTVEMNGVRYTKGDIVTVEPGEIVEFRAITSVTNVVVKLPGASNDKYLA